MKRNLLLIALCTLTLSVGAQSPELFKHRLGESDPNYGSSSIVNEHGSAASATQAVSARPTQESVRGYRVRIFFDNSQNARTLANQTIDKFKEAFPTIPAYLTYSSPDFKVTVGNCLTIEEADILFGKVQGTFDRSFVVPEEIPLSLFGEQISTPTPTDTQEQPSL